MYFKVSYDQDFDDLMMYLRGKYPKELFDLEGIGEQTDLSKFSKKFFSSTVTADASIDANANVEDTGVIVYNTELPKPFFKVNSYYILWKELKKAHGLGIANKIVEQQLSGDIYIHDFHGIGAGLPYCFNYSTYDIMTKGLPMVKKIKSSPPKYLYSFKSQLEQFTVIASNSTLGATGLADMLVVMSYYVKQMLETGVDAHFDLIGLDLGMTFTEEQKEYFVSSCKKIKDELYSTLSKKQQDLIGQESFGLSFNKEFFESLNETQEELIKNNRLNMISSLIKTFSEDQKCLYERNIYKYVRENLVSFIYTINQPMRANQSPFTNISVYDKYFLEKLSKDYLFPDGSNPDISIVEKLQDLYLTCMNQELKRTPITFPVTTACFCVDKDHNILDLEFLKKIAHYNSKYGFINFYCGDKSTLSSCCRLRSDTESEYFNSFGSGSSKIGSLGVTSINFPRLALLSYNKRLSREIIFENFCTLLTEYLVVSSQVNNAKRSIVKKRIKNGNHPLYTYEFIDINKQYSTTGVNGLYECLEILGYDIMTPEGQEATIKIMKLINEKNKEFDKLYGVPHNVEQVPGENMSIKMAEKDKLLKFQSNLNIYSNQFIPLTANVDLIERMKLQGLFDKHFSGGAIAHLNIDSEVSPDKIVNLVLAAAKMGIVYFAVNYNIQECENGHVISGKNLKCTICNGEIINNYTRVVGFLVNVKNFHKVRRETDYPNRVFHKPEEL